MASTSSRSWAYPRCSHASDRGTSTSDIGLSNREGTSTLYECPTRVGLSTFSEEQAADLRRQGFDLVEHSTPVTTLARVCEQYADQDDRFSQDRCRELRAGSAGRRRLGPIPSAGVLGRGHSAGDEHSEHEHWEPILLEADYLFAFFDGLNRYYVREEDRHLLPLLGVPANVFDEYETYEYHRQIRELRCELEASQESRARTQAAPQGRAGRGAECPHGNSARTEWFANRISRSSGSSSAPLKISLRLRNLSSPHSKN